VGGGTVQLQATFGETALSQRTGRGVAANGPEAFQDDAPLIRVVPDGFSFDETPTWSPGARASYRQDTALPNQLGWYTMDITWTFQVHGDGRWETIPGTQTTQHRLYLTAGQTRVPDGRGIDASPAVSWIGVLDDLSDAVTGLKADNQDVIMDALRESLHNDPWFVYNPGDAAYSDFDGPYIYWDDIWVEMSQFLDRKDGVDLYCHSVACVLSSQANHLGIDAHYLTLGVGFNTHLTRAAGSDEWRRWGFNSHGITELNGKVWDAAVDIDGDDKPDTTPVTPVKPMGIPVDDYFRLLTADDVETVNYGRCFVY